MIRLIRIGYWQSEREPDLPHPSRLVDPAWDHRERELVVGYLRGGFPVLHMMGYSPCRICAENNGASELTDGTYLWPEGLPHYLANHDVRLPQEFINHAVRRSTELDDAAVRAHHDASSMDDWLRLSG